MITATIVSGVVFTFCYVATMVRNGHKNANDLKIRNHQITTDSNQDIKFKEMEFRNKELDYQHEEKMAHYEVEKIKATGTTVDLRRLIDAVNTNGQKQLPPMNGSGTKTG